MKKTFTILFTKICYKILKLFGRGSSLPGELACKIDKDILKKFQINGKIIAVTGSSGKGSTSSLIVNTLRNLGYTVAHNMEGSNLKFGIVTLLARYSNLKGVLNQDYLVFEIDERYTKYVFCDLEPDFVVVTNITRDQPPRQANVDTVLSVIKNAIPNKSHIIINADSPYMQNLIIDMPNQVSYYSVDKNDFSTEENLYKNLNIFYCPRCNHKLEYTYYNFEENGKYKCTNDRCGFENNDAICKVTNIDFEKDIIKINDTYEITTNTKLLFNIYNIAACFCTLQLLDLDLKKCAEYLSTEKLSNKIYSTYTNNSRDVFVLNNKNENATTFNGSLHFLNMSKKPKTVIIGWWQISRRYEFNDISWLYDVDFEILNKHDIENIICVGPERFDIATRIKLANILKDKIFIFDNLKDATTHIKEKTTSDIYAILNFDYVEPFNLLMIGGKK